MKLPRLSALALLVIAGCTAPTPRTLNTLTIGMTKAEVTAKMGEPTSTRARGTTEILVYNLNHTSYRPPLLDPSELPEYFVKLVDGRVESFGKVGDFDSTKDPTVNINARVSAEGR